MIKNDNKIKEKALIYFISISFFPLVFYFASIIAYVFGIIGQSKMMKIFGVSTIYYRITSAPMLASIIMFLIILFFGFIMLMEIRKDKFILMFTLAGFLLAIFNLWKVFL